MSCETSQTTHRALLEQLLKVTTSLRQELALLEDAQQPANNSAGPQEPLGGPAETQGEPLMAATSNVHEVLESLAMEHEILSVALREAGLSEDPSLIPLVEKVWREVQEVLLALQVHHDRTMQALATRQEQRRRIAAYVKAAGRFSP